LPQEASIFRKLTVEENIRAVLELQSTTGQAARSADRRLLDALLHDLSIEKLRDRRRRRCPAASAGASRSPARWPRSRASSCSTSRSPASIRSR
jgi:lipopolysaccharide export system ATP-binding protein